MFQAKKTSCAKDLRKEGLEYFKEMQIVQKNAEEGSGLEDWQVARPSGRGQILKISLGRIGLNAV